MILEGEIPEFEIKTILNICAAIIAISLGMVESGTKQIALEPIETTSELVSNSIEAVYDFLATITQYTGLSSVFSFLTRIVELIAKVPELIVTVIKNAIVFFCIFCVLILVGQFDWLLDDIYTLTGISLLLTYLTYR